MKFVFITIQKAKLTILQLETAVKIFKEWQNILCKMYNIPATILHGHVNYGAT